VNRWLPEFKFVGPWVLVCATVTKMKLKSNFNRIPAMRQGLVDAQELDVFQKTDEALKS
jgi:hypothetical protein